MPRLGTYLADMTCDGIVSAEALEMLPMPKKVTSGTQAWDPEAGTGNKPSKLLRALYALPILTLSYACVKTVHMSTAIHMPALEAAAASGQLVLDGGIAAPIRRTFYGITGLDKILSIFVAVFTPSIGGYDPSSRMQMIAFLADLAPLQAIWSIESIRRGNFLTVASVL